MCHGATVKPLLGALPVTVTSSSRPQPFWKRPGFSHRGKSLTQSILRRKIKSVRWVTGLVRPSSTGVKAWWWRQNTALLRWASLSPGSALRHFSLVEVQRLLALQSFLAFCKSILIQGWRAEVLAPNWTPCDCGQVIWPLCASAFSSWWGDGERPSLVAWLGGLNELMCIKYWVCR